VADSVLRRKIAELEPWFHNLHLPGGVQTCPDHPLGDFPRFKWQKLEPHLPPDMRGLSVLDIGCNAGFYSLELAKRGALVTAIDVNEHYLAQARWAAQIYDVSDRITFQRSQVYALSGARRRWDLVLFLGVLYHLRYPLLGLDIVSRCVGRQLVLQSFSTPDTAELEVPRDLELGDREPLTRAGWPKLSFVEHRVAGDQTNWWAPNPACLEAMLRSTGLHVISRPLDEFYICEPEAAGWASSSMWGWNAEEFFAAIGSHNSLP